MISSEQKKIDGLKKGDKLIFEKVYREHYLPLCYYCFKYVENLEDAEEIVQNLFLKLWDKRDELDINTSLKSYLYRAVQNYALNDLSKKQTKEKYIHTQQYISDYYQDGNSNMEEEELRVILKHAILQLPEKRREIFEMSRFEGLKYNSIANKLSISVKTVETQMSKSLKYLRVVLKDYIPVIGIISLIISMMG